MPARRRTPSQLASATAKADDLKKVRREEGSSRSSLQAVAGQACQALGARVHQYIRAKGVDDETEG